MSDDKAQKVILSGMTTPGWIMLALTIIIALNIRACTPKAVPDRAIDITETAVYNLKGSSDMLYLYTLPDNTKVYVYDEKISVVQPERK